MKVTFHIIEKKDFDEDHRKILARMLEQQGKVKGDLDQKIDRCKLICIVDIENDVAAIGAIKQKTELDFSPEKADLPGLANDFEWELGYLYAQENYVSRGIASTIAKLLIKEYGEGNLMASTEITANPAMVNILEKNGFRLFGKPWKSSIHENYLGLYLKFK
jgi:hypothetical protein